MQSFLHTIFSHIFPEFCLLCQVYGVDICEECLLSIQPDPKWVRRGELEIFTLYDYQNKSIQKLLHVWKYQQKTKFLDVLFRFDVKVNFLQEYTLVPVPMHKRRYTQRGMDHANDIAQRLERLLQGKTLQLLKRKKNTKQQALLSEQERKENMNAAFAISKEAQIKDTILLIDDVVSTGQTLLACKKVLEEQYPKQKILAFCLARNE